VDHIKNHCSDVEVIVGLDARGFIFGSLVAQQMSLPFVPVRKEGKLPGETIKAAYTLEYAEVNKWHLTNTVSKMSMSYCSQVMKIYVVSGYSFVTNFVTK